MKRFLILTAMIMLLAVSAQAGDPVWGPGGYAASLSRLQGKGNATEQRDAEAELRRLDANQAHLNKLIAFLNR